MNLTQEDYSILLNIEECNEDIATYKTELRKYVTKYKECVNKVPDVQLKYMNAKIAENSEEIEKYTKELKSLSGWMRFCCIMINSAKEGIQIEKEAITEYIDILRN